MALLTSYDIFISYARRDSLYAKKLNEFLTSLDYTCFYDERELPGGHPVKTTILSAVRASKVLVLIGSSTALTRPYVQMEFEAFLGTQRPIVPICVGNSFSEVAATAPWMAISQRDLKWFDETEHALAAGLPSPWIYEGIQNRFRYTRQRVIRRRVITILFAAILMASATAVWKGVDAARNQRLVEDETAKLRAQAGKLKSANAALESQTAVLNAKTREAKENAEKARHQELIAIENTRNAVRRQLAAQALAAANEGQRVFEGAPVTGLLLAISALKSCPPTETAALVAAKAVVRSLLKVGRVHSFAPDGLEDAYFLAGATFFVRSKAGGVAQFVDVRTGALIRQLSDPIVNVRDSIKDSDDGGSASFYGLPEGADKSPYFIVDYADGTSELFRKPDGHSVTRSKFTHVQFYNLTFYRIFNNSHLTEIRRVGSDDALGVPDYNGVMDHLIDGDPFFLYQPAGGPDELRETSTGRVLETFPSYADDLQFSSDLSIYAITMKRRVYFETRGEYRWEPDRVIMYRTRDRMPIVLSGVVRHLTFDPNSTAYVVSYASMPGELRYLDSEVKHRLSGIVKQAGIDKTTGDLAIVYADAPCEIRHHNGTVARRLSKPCSDLGLLETTPPLFWFNAGDETVMGRASGKLWTAARSEGTFRWNSQFYWETHDGRGWGEVHQASDGSAVKIDDQSSSLTDWDIIDDSTFMLFRRKVGPSALLDTTNGTITLLPDKRFDTAANLRLSPDRKTVSLRSLKSWALVHLPAGPVVSWDNASMFIAHAESSYARFSADSSLVYAPGGYLSLPGSGLNRLPPRRPGDIRRVSDGSVLIPNVSEAVFINSTPWFFVTHDGHSELWAAGQFPHTISELGVGVEGFHFEDRPGRAIVRYKDKRAFVLDVDWLEMSRTLPDELSTERLVEVACQPFRGVPLEAPASDLGLADVCTLAPRQN